MAFTKRNNWKTALAQMAFALLFVAIAGCVTMSNSDRDTTVSSKEMVTVIGVNDVHSVALIAGNIVDNKFVAVKEGYAANIRPKDGYVVAKLPIRNDATHYAIAGVLMAPGGKSFNECNWGQVFAFPAHGGKVVYTGQHEFAAKGNVLQWDTEKDLVGASKFVDANYTNLTGRTEYLEPTRLSRAVSKCQGATTYIIYR